MCILLFKNLKINTLSSKNMQTEKAKSSHFDRTRGDKKQIFPTLMTRWLKFSFINLLQKIQFPNRILNYGSLWRLWCQCPRPMLRWLRLPTCLYMWRFLNFWLLKLKINILSISETANPDFFTNFLTCQIASDKQITVRAPS